MRSQLAYIEHSEVPKELFVECKNLVLNVNQ